MVLVTRLIASTSLLLAASAVSAATYTFDLQNLASDNPDKGDAGTLVDNTLTITEGDLTGTFTGRIVDDIAYTSDEVTSGTFSEAHSVRRHYNGLGVCGIGDCFAGDPIHSVDGTQDGGTQTEFVEMSFFSGSDLVEVTLASLTFGWIGDFRYGYDGTNGSFELLLDASDDGSIGLSDILTYEGVATANISSFTSRGSVDLTTSSTSMAAMSAMGFAEGVSAWLAGTFETDAASVLSMDFTDDTFGVKAGENGSWKLLAVTVDYIPTTTTTPIPLPAAGWLLIGGLAGLAALRRKKAV